MKKRILEKGRECVYNSIIREAFAEIMTSKPTPEGAEGEAVWHLGESAPGRGPTMGLSGGR